MCYEDPPGVADGVRCLVPDTALRSERLASFQGYKSSDARKGTCRGQLCGQTGWSGGREPVRDVSTHPARARCPASVIITQTTPNRRPPARMVPGCLVAKPSRRRAASSSALKP